MSKIIISILLVLLYVGEAFAADPIVYSRCKRTTSTYELSGTVTVNGESLNLTRTMTGLDAYDVLPDVTNFLGNFSAPCDLVYRDANGVETVIYNCSATSTDQNACAALDPAVSFDGKIIAFSVFRGSLFNYKESVNARVLHPDAESANLGTKTLPNKRLKTTGAHLHFYTIATAETLVMPFTSGVYDSGPAFISNSRVAFTSTRDGNTSTLVFRTSLSKPGSRIWAVDIDGRNPDLSSHHSLSQEQHPFMLKNGRLAYSSWQIFGGLPFRQDNGSVGGFTTIDNLFHIYAQDPDGAHNFPIFGQHFHGEGYFGENHTASHFITQTSDERIWFADYYRDNNSGLGILVGVVAEPSGQEGFGPTEVTNPVNLFLPRDVINFAGWASNADITSNPLVSPAITHPAYADPIPFAGKISHPFALPNNGLGLSWGKGACGRIGKSDVFLALGRTAPTQTNGMGGGVLMNIITSLNIDTPGCDVGIYRATQIPSQHPNDLEMIVDSPDWNEIMARAVVPYSAIHGVDRPEIIARSDLRTSHATLVTGTPFGLLGAASITDRETHPIDGIHFQGEEQFNLQGTDTIDYIDEELCGVRILGIMPNRSTSTVQEIANYAGERVSILGEFPVLNRDASGNRVIDPSGHPDTSFLVRMPANTPYLMQGVDCNGRTLNTDQTWQSLRPGEQKTCGGCHVHSKPTRITFGQSFAATPAYVIPRLGEGTVPLLAGISGETVQTRSVPGYGMRIEFTQDIKPIFDQRCIACHGGGSPAAGLDLSLTNVANNNVAGTTWHKLIADRSGNFRRPQLTRYVRAFNSRGSLLYWKAANQRTDNRTDGEYADDIDFGAAHPTSITADELGLLSRWIDIGAPGGAQELKDTQKPTLHMVAIVANNAITQLLIGTVDHGAGINTASLNVCLVSGASCGSNLASTAQQHGITTIDLGTPISDADQIIRATVSDSATIANTTQIELTAGYLIQQSSGVAIPEIAVSAGGNATIIVGDTFSRTISFIDGEDNDSPGRTYSINWCGAEQTGSVSAGNFSFNISRLFSTAGSCLVSVTVTDGTGETDTGSFTITIEEDAPTETVTISVGGPGLVKEGSSLARIVSISDVSVNWTYSLSVDGSEVDTGSITNGHNSFSVEHIFPDGPAVHNVEVEVSSSVPAVLDTKSFQVTVLNVEPTVTITGNTTVAVNTPYTFSYNVVDPGDDTVIGITVDWGDNNYTNMTTHTYTSEGEYRITVWIEDEDNIWNAGSFKLTVTE